MSDFKVLQKKAIKLPADLTQSNNTGLFGTFFGSCLPLNRINIQHLNDAELLKLVAESLNFYKAASERLKFDILVGMYIFIWERHDTPVEWIWDKSLFNAMRNHLGVDDIHDLEREYYDRALLSLRHYFTWLNDNQNTVELNPTWLAFPLDTQSLIHALLCAEPEEEKISWNCGIFNYC
ncbi:hypothetical protein [Legionella genomosp. 1]|uniref:hypothetical protein n=1 Tax=Legionella genomosp. 1 TaxID=1093625 RepID=UPI00105478DC|nr:hypothetical protein [Legionella genomosp. 1]